MVVSLPHDVLLEILVRLKEAPALFRCATVCKRWRSLIVDISFLRRRWPEHACPSFAGFLTKNRRRDQGAKLLIPTPQSALGHGRRTIRSFVPTCSASLLYRAVPLLSRRGLLLVRLGPPYAMDRNVAHLAVCNLLGSATLPPIHVGCFSLCSDVNSGDHERSGCAILTGEDCRSNDNDDNQPPSGNLPFFKVIILTASFYDLKFDLHAFSSDKVSWKLSAEDKANLAESIKNTLQGLAARHTDVLESLEPKVRKQVEALTEIQSAAGPNGSQAMAEFIGSAVPNGVASFINVGHSAALGSIGDVTGFGQDQQFTAVQMLFRSYEAAEPITRLGLNGSYEIFLN
ncbi:hypothetical protein ZWY2020_022865 [Hordeum vulgare]|nr:hypothetical protein ZWY2020_022865 [Hordeum vulgare]